ncbi:MAG: hypothetical protein Q8Q03_02810 [bacterium]|nr:hypothetical protein [bacterium]
MKAFLSKYRIDLLVFGLALCARLALFMVNFDASKGDLIGTIHGDDGYYEISQSLIKGNGFTWDTEEPFRPQALRTPLYIYFISGILLATGSFWAVIIIQMLIGSCIPFLGRRISLRLNPSRSIAMFVGILLAFEP